MRSLDANIPIRVMLKDNPEQERLAWQILSAPSLLLSTVILEMVLVLTGKGWAREQVAAAFKKLLELERLYVPDEQALIWVIERYEFGGDFADMFHVALSLQATVFTTFDQKLQRYCQEGAVPIETL